MTRTRTIALGLASCLALASMSALADPLSPPPVGDMPPSPPPHAHAAYDEGQALMAQKQYAAAMEKMKQATAAEPGFAPGWYGLALAARRATICGEAIPAYRHYATLRPDEAEPYFGLGLCLRDMGDRPGAVAALKKFMALAQRPGQEKWIETASSLITTLDTPPAAPVATVGRGAAAYEDAKRLRDGGKIDAALGRFAEAAALDPDLMSARAAWGELLIKIDRDAEAVVVFRAALDRNAQYPLIWYELAFALRETGRFKEAVEAYRRYITLRPTDPDPHFGLARALAKLGRREDALRSYQTYVAMENRPGEGRWVTSAKTEIAALARTGDNRPANDAAPTAGIPAQLAAPASAPAPSAPARDRTAAEPR